MLPNIQTATSYPGPPAYVLLQVVAVDDQGTETGEPYIYVLYKDDPYGDAPALRQQLQTMVDEEGFEIEGGLPEGWPWWVEPPPPPIEDTGP